MNQNPMLNIAIQLVTTQQYAQAEPLLINIIQNGGGSANAWQLLAHTSAALEKYTQGLFAAWQANALQTSAEMQVLFARCLNHVAITAHDPQLQMAVAKAVAETWGAPAELAEHAGKLLKLDPLIQPYLQTPSDQPISVNDIYALNNHSLLNTLLQSAPVCDLELERFLTALRKTLLLNPELTQQADQLTASLAQQCFINEYIYSISDAETTALNNLDRAELSLILGCYQPLHTCDEAETWSTKTWPAATLAVIQQQIIEPRTEATLVATMPALTAISDGVSQDVQAMYEESPYPRWVRVSKYCKSQDLNSFLAQVYPLSGFIPLTLNQQPQILIAGGGTGQHPIYTARFFNDAEIQVIDLSRHSLAYAQRKCNELNLTNLKFAQADILQIGQVDKEFDLIESVGVLHHMADPWVGWEALLTRLKPNGLMTLGLYSKTARQGVNQLRDFIKEQRFGNTPEAIRACRQHLIKFSQSANFEKLLRMRDFFSTSACRDLLFHVQEHQLTLPEIDTFLKSHGLRFIGFETDTNTLDTYRQEFPDDLATTNLSNWHQFEQRHPGTFISMYQFWIQKTS